MNSHTYQALTRPARLILRSTVMVLVLLSSILVQSSSFREEARADENSPLTTSGLTVDFGSLPLSFVPNVGQLDPHIHYYVHGMGSELLFAPDEVTLIVPSSAEEGATQTVRLSFVGADQNPTISTAGSLPGIVNYLYGNDPDQWLTNIPTYAGVMYELLYPGISLHYDGTHGMLKGTYLIQPGADPDLIRWQYAGVARMQLDPATQDLRLYLSDAAESVYLTELAPLAWQEIGGAHVPVETHYTLFDDQTIGFTLGSYDPSLALYVDPSIQYSTYLGGAYDDEGFGIAVDNSANAYITGHTLSDNMPTQLPLQGGRAGDYDAFVTKISMSTSTLVFSTYLGDTGYDGGADIAVDANNNVYVTGETRSSNFPTTTGAYDTSFNGNADAFVTKLNASGSALVYSTFLGGSLSDRGAGIAVDASGNAYVTGATGSSVNFPIVNPIPGYSTYGGGASDGFVAKFNAAASAAVFSTFLGGPDVDNSSGIAADASYVYVAGLTHSATGFSGTYGGAGDAFVAKISTTGTPALVYANYLGGSGFDQADAIATDGSGKAYVTGNTESSDFPQLSGLSAPDGGTDHGGIDAFVTAYTSNGQQRIFSTYLGGDLDDKGLGIGLDSSGNIYVAGGTQSTNFPYRNGFQAGGNGGGSDAFITKIVASSPAALEYSSYLGGGLVDLANDLAVSQGGSAYLTGDTSSDNFPVTPNTRERGGSFDAFVTRIGSTAADVAMNKVDDIEPVALGQNLPYTITVRNLGPDPTTVSMTDKLSIYVTYVSATPSKGTCSYDTPTRTVSCLFGNMLGGDIATVALVVNVAIRPATGTIYNQATAVSTEFDPVDWNNIESEYTQVDNQADLEVTKLADSYRVRQNEDVTFSVSIHNLGPGSASVVYLTDKLSDWLPPEVTYVSHVAPPGTTYDADPLSPTYGKWTVGTVAANATTTLTITAHVGALPVGSTISNTANNLHSTTFDPQTDNNSSTITLRVVTDYPEPGCHPSPTNPNEVICLTH